MNISEDTLKNWAKPPSNSENQRCENAIKMVKDAINNDPVLSNKNIRIFGQGSYQNNTNVRLNSDVDVCAVLEDVFYFKLPEGRTRDEFGLNSPSSYTFSEYKSRMETALRTKFGNEVSRGNKSLKIRSNNYHVDIDVVPAFDYRRYSGDKDYYKGFTYADGIKLFSDSGESVVNFPKQHQENGASKNTQTNHNYKYATRILKRINYELDDDGFIPSFLVECLAWNVPNTVYSDNYNYRDMLRSALYHIYDHTDNEEKSDEWGEVSELLYLFRGHSKWTKQHARDFSHKAWNYIGYN